VVSAPYFTDAATGPVDFYDPTDPVVLELLAADGITVDAGGRAHSKSDGRFVAKALDYPHLTATGPARPRVRPGQYGDQTWRVTGYRPTAQEVATWELGPDTWQSLPSVSVFDWPTAGTPRFGKPSALADEPGVSAGVVSSCCAGCVWPES
jgi:hypothetical protein